MFRVFLTDGCSYVLFLVVSVIVLAIIEFTPLIAIVRQFKKWKIKYEIIGLVVYTCVTITLYVVLASLEIIGNTLIIMNAILWSIYVRLIVAFFANWDK